MSIALAVALYFVVWWMTLFAVLPFGVRSQAESGNVVPGTPAGAPEQHRMRRVVIINTLVAAAVYTVIVIVMYFDLLGITEMATKAKG
jgi:predicted secreted protein